jgi:hypothetical protein
MPACFTRSIASAPVSPSSAFSVSEASRKGAVVECEHHGHRHDRADPDAWNRAREEAWRNPFSSVTPEACIAAMNEVMRSIGDTCPVLSAWQYRNP